MVVYSWFMDNCLLLCITRSVLVQSSSSTHCWVPHIHHAHLLTHIVYGQSNKVYSWDYTSNHISSTRYLLMIWSGSISGLLTPSSNRRRFHERNPCIRTYIWNIYLFCVCGKIYNVCFHKIPWYARKNPLLSYHWKRDPFPNTTVLSLFPKHVILTKVGLYPQWVLSYKIKKNSQGHADI